MAQSIKGKTAIVTGAGSGINLEFARLLLQRGANVLFADLALRPEAESLVAQYAAGSPRAVFHRTDVTSWLDLSSMFTTAQSAFNAPIDIVCPGAGVFEPPFSNFWIPPGTAPSRDKPEDSRYALLDINVTHPIRTTQLAISHFLATDPGPSAANPKTIVHIASIAGEASSLPFPMYHASKHAIFGFVRSLASLEESHGIRVAGVAPGIVKTPLWTDNPEKMQIVNDQDKSVGGDDWITPAEVAATMLAIVEQNEVEAAFRPGSKADSKMVPITGGCMLEVTAGVVRDVPMFNNVGPFGLAGTRVSNAAVMVESTLALLKPGWGK